jgi:hypothetical protein
MSAAIKNALNKLKGVNINKTLKNRVSRLNLNPEKCYAKIQTTNGGMDEESYVGRFVRAYRMGSGNGMTAHWEFNDNGKIITVDDQMWGSVNGKELAGFMEVPCSSGGSKTRKTTGGKKLTNADAAELKIPKYVKYTLKQVEDASTSMAGVLQKYSIDYYKDFGLLPARKKATKIFDDLEKLETMIKKNKYYSKNTSSSL